MHINQGQRSGVVLLTSNESYPKKQLTVFADQAAPLKTALRFAIGFASTVFTFLTVSCVFSFSLRSRHHWQEGHRHFQLYFRETLQHAKDWQSLGEDQRPVSAQWIQSWGGPHAGVTERLVKKAAAGQLDSFSSCRVRFIWFSFSFSTSSLVDSTGLARSGG